MSDALADYHAKIEECLMRSQHQGDEAAAVWREIANGYRLLVALDEEQRALNSALIRQR